MSDKGVLTVISVFSGDGKGTVVKQLLDKPVLQERGSRMAENISLRQRKNSSG